jgi:hypothetical protein
VTVTAPDTNGVTWPIGSTKAVKFIHDLGKGALVKVELNRDYPGGSWETLAASTPTSAAANSTFNWVVTGPATTGATARVRVTSLTFASATDTGNASFTIKERVKVTAPNTNVKWKVGLVKTIKWTHNYPLPHAFKVEIDRDGDGVCEQVLKPSVSATAATGTWDWTVAGPAGTTNRICVTSTTDPAGKDISDVPFTILP